jgi:hypothetical protein
MYIIEGKGPGIGPWVTPGKTKVIYKEINMFLMSQRLKVLFKKPFVHV